MRGIRMVERRCFATPWDGECFEEHAVEGGSIIGAFVGNRIAGYIAFVRRGNFVLISRVAVLPSFRRHGLGGKLVRRLMQDASRMRCGDVRLKTRESNAGALAFYERLGFATYGHLDSYYDDGERALLLKKRLRSRVA